MIASLTGTVGQVSLDRLVLVVGGVGMLVHTTPAVAASVHRGQEATLATSLVVREESLTLFGFPTERERDLFETLQSVSGVGPRLALASLSVLTPDDLAAALASGDLATLTKIPGVGKKSAERLVLELRDKVAASTAVNTPAGAATHAAASALREQVTQALVGLGWSLKQAGDAVDFVVAQSGHDAEVSTVLRLALRTLSR
jgi:Holliday junction DNA helicase RuvA